MEQNLHVYWLPVPPGHFDSPIPNMDDIAQMKSNEAKELLGKYDLLDVPWHSDTAKQLFLSLYSLHPDFDRDIVKSRINRYSFENIYFSGMDAFVLYALIRSKKPKRIFEVGSGYSSALIMDTVEKYYDVNESFRLVCIDPFAERLKEQIGQPTGEQIKIMEQRIQDIDPKMFKELESGDFLFVDSSHVAKAGSDINHIFFHILPLLAKGVWVHFHDIFWPFTYPEAWFTQGRFWSEVYFLRAFLQNNDTFYACLSNDYILQLAAMNKIVEEMPEFLKHDASSFWIEKIK
ncbi:MAG: class I SAM-dependent methyltransferase [Candidatus Omnitrophica bacterium]|nr:class I SAM-dependent methyltransferase [Candidatus Omnitrophota bacterium]